MSDKKYVFLISGQNPEAKMWRDLLLKYKIPSKLKPSGAPTIGSYSESVHLRVFVPEDKLEEAKKVLGIDKKKPV